MTATMHDLSLMSQSFATEASFAVSAVQAPPPASDATFDISNHQEQVPCVISDVGTGLDDVDDHGGQSSIFSPEKTIATTSVEKFVPKALPDHEFKRRLAELKKKTDTQRLKLAERKAKFDAMMAETLEMREARWERVRQENRKATAAAARAWCEKNGVPIPERLQGV